jgi:Type IV secretion system proteins
MKRFTLVLMISAAAPSIVHADIRVFDRTTYAQARKTAEATADILDTNKEVLKTVEETLKAVTGARGSEAGDLKNLATGNGFSVTAMPSFDSVLSGGVPDFGSLSGEITQAATTFINALQLVKSLSGQENSDFASDKSYEQLLSTVTAVSALVNGTKQAAAGRRSALESAGNKIGEARDIKGSVDQNSQLQVQTGLTLNELIGVMNGAVASLQAENQRRLTDISNTKKSLSYDRGDN